MNDVGIADVVDHYAGIIGNPAVKPIVIGHSFGGLFAQQLLASGHVAAAVDITVGLALPRDNAGVRVDVGFLSGRNEILCATTGPNLIT